jgi:hypothetical protein
MENSDPRRYREAAVALELQDLENSTYRALLSRGRIARRVRRLVGGNEWDFRRPLLDRDEADRFRHDLTRIGVDARWQGPILAISSSRAVASRPDRSRSPWALRRRTVRQSGSIGLRVRAGVDRGRTAPPGARHRCQRPHRVSRRQDVSGLRQHRERRAEGRSTEHDLRPRIPRSRGGGAIIARADRQPARPPTRRTSASHRTCSPPEPLSPRRSTASSSDSAWWR